MDRGAWQATVHGVTKIQTQLRTNTFTFAHLVEKWVQNMQAEASKDKLLLHSLDVSLLLAGTHVVPQGLSGLYFWHGRKARTYIQVRSGDPNTASLSLPSFALISAKGKISCLLFVFGSSTPGIRTPLTRAQ